MDFIFGKTRQSPHQRRVETTLLNDCDTTGDAFLFAYSVVAISSPNMVATKES